MPDYVSANHIAAAAGAFEPQRKNNYTLQFNIPGGTEILQQSLDSLPWPEEKNDPIEVNFGNEQRKVAGIAKFKDLALVLKDFADQPVMKNLIKWRRLVYDPKTGVIGLASKYKMTGRVSMMAPNGTVFRNFKLVGMWPSAMDPGGGDMNANENNKITITLTIDKAIEDRNLI